MSKRGTRRLSGGKSGNSGSYKRGGESAAASVKPVTHSDPNITAAGLLYDMAELQGSERARFGYKRAAKAVVGLPVSVADLVEAGTLGDVPYIGPSSTRIVTELVREGRSPTVETAVAASARERQLAAKRQMRGNFLSYHRMLQTHGEALGPEVVSRGPYRGDFQMHTTWSDGGEGLASMAEACMALGYTCMGVTDHSYGLPVARGMSMSAVAQQHHEIDRFNARHRGRFRVFKGIEANILADGSLDLQPDDCGLFEFVVASPHSALRRTDDQTQRMLAAIRAPRVAILGHPRGRVYNSRAGVVADWRQVFEEAAARRVAIEIDGNWHRQDLDFELAAAALEAGCLFALDSDAHSIGELGFTDFAIAHARIARVPAERVINTWSEEELDAWMGER